MNKCKMQPLTIAYIFTHLFSRQDSSPDPLPLLQSPHCLHQLNAIFIKKNCASKFSLIFLNLNKNRPGSASSSELSESGGPRKPKSIERSCLLSDLRERFLLYSSSFFSCLVFLVRIPPCGVLAADKSCGRANLTSKNPRSITEAKRFSLLIVEIQIYSH